jgi:hypothetical protein
MKFVLDIELGNDAMQNWSDIAWALYDVARGIRTEAPMIASCGARIKDVNGNTVGSWSIVDE